MTRTISAALATLALGLGAAAIAADPKAPTNPVGVHDGAGMFSADAVKEARDALRDVRRKTGWSTAIETVDSIGEKTIKEAAVANAEKLQEHGLYVLIAKKQHKFYAEPSNAARKAFTREAIKEIDGAITAGFKAGDFDGGLRDAVATIRKYAEATPDRASSAAAAEAPAPAGEAAHPSLPGPRANGPIEHRPAPPAGGLPQESTSMLPMLLIGGAAVLLVLWLISRAFRGGQSQPGVSQQAYNQPGGGYVPPGQGGYAPGNRPGPGYGRPIPPQPGYAPPPQPGYGYGPPPVPQQGGGGGGFLSGVLGGAAGAVAGNILYDQFGRPHAAPGVPPEVAHHGGVAPTQGDAWPQSGGDAGTGAPIPPQETYDPDAGGGGDWGAPDPAQNVSPTEAGVGGDWGAPEPDQGAGGDWGAAEPDQGAGGDWGGGGDDSGGAGGDWGGGSDDAGTTDDQGGSW